MGMLVNLMLTNAFPISSEQIFISEVIYMSPLDGSEYSTPLP